MWPRLGARRRRQNLVFMNAQNSRNVRKYRRHEGEHRRCVAEGQLGLVLEPTRAFHWPLSELGDLGFREHGRPKLRLARVLRGDEGIFRPIREDQEAMAPQNISVCLSGHRDSELQKPWAAPPFVLSTQKLAGDSWLWGAFVRRLFQVESYATN